MTTAGLAVLDRAAPREARPLSRRDFDVARAFDEHGSLLLGLAVNALGDRHAAEDCVQETLVRAWRARDTFRAERGSERTWLVAIARRVIIDSARARSRRPVEVRAVPPEPAPQPGVDAQVADRVTLLAGLARLSPEHRQVVVEVQVRGLSYDELSHLTGVGVGTLRSRMYYALRALRGILTEEADHDDA
ncbi:sigma-70 family RNA polymerase sigma factor [uncultured Serinicoccus sp.]|uniref:sigma-70 family RNA polymerase sigma factor n=1 Tax=uncultured Serinicoccus sp. TaxID=735514 RepID=UPI00262B9B28|nr:sigma-70 family RNA polymerase sigma factor [uncultured Serinicoccus sp.]